MNFDLVEFVLLVPNLVLGTMALVHASSFICEEERFRAYLSFLLTGTYTWLFLCILVSTHYICTDSAQIIKVISYTALFGVQMYGVYLFFLGGSHAFLVNCGDVEGAQFLRHQVTISLFVFGLYVFTFILLCCKRKEAPKVHILTHAI